MVSLVRNYVSCLKLYVLFKTENISPTVTRRATLARLCSLFLVVAFLFAQTFSASHSHDHDATEPLHQSCKVCILAANNDGDLDIVADLEADAKDMSFFWAQIDHLALPEAERAPSVDYIERSIDPPPDPNQRPDAARAPPLYI